MEIEAVRAGLNLHENGGWQHPEDPGEPSASSHGKPRISISDQEARILAALAIDSEVVEIGTGLGVSTRALLMYAFSVCTVDIDPWVHENIWPALRDEGAETVADREELRGERAPDFIFIDADHTPEAVARDLDFARELIYRPGLIVMHDTNFDNIREGIAIAGLKKDDWAHVPTEHGLGLMVVTA